MGNASSGAPEPAPQPLRQPMVAAPGMAAHTSAWGSVMSSASGVHEEARGPLRTALRRLGESTSPATKALGRRWREAPRPARVAGRALGGLGALYGGLYLSLAAFRAWKKRSLRALLEHVVPALQQCGQTFWLDFGTLRSLASSGDVFEHDNDADLVILEPNFETLLPHLQAVLGKKGFRVEWVGKERPLGDGLSQKWIRVYMPSRLVWVDLYGGWRFHGKVRINKNPDCDIPDELLFPLGQVTLWGKGVAPAPANIGGTMEMRYGPEWHVDKYAVKGRDKVEHEKRYLRVLRALGAIGLKI